MPLGVPKAGDVPGKQALAGRSSPTACAGRGERSSPGGMASPRWMRACRIPPCEAHLGYSNGAQLHWVQELKTTGALRGACGRREWCTLRWGRLPVPAKGGWSGWTWCWRLAAPAASGRHPFQTDFLERRVGTFLYGRVDSVVLGGHQGDHPRSCNSSLISTSTSNNIRTMFT